MISVYIKIALEIFFNYVNSKGWLSIPKLSEKMLILSTKLMIFATIKGNSLTFKTATL